MFYYKIIVYYTDIFGTILGYFYLIYSAVVVLFVVLSTKKLCYSLYLVYFEITILQREKKHDFVMRGSIAEKSILLLIKTMWQRFLQTNNATVAQPVEQRFRKPQVAGSSPVCGSKKIYLFYENRKGFFIVFKMKLGQFWDSCIFQGVFS